MATTNVASKGFAASTQWTHWTFRDDELARLRRLPPSNVHTATSQGGDDSAVASATTRKRPRNDVSSDVVGDDDVPTKRVKIGSEGGGEANDDDGSMSSAPGPSPVANTFSPTDEQRLLRYYELEIQQACREAPFDRAVMATAVIFFKRHFVMRSALTLLPPSDIV